MLYGLIQVPSSSSTLRAKPRANRGDSGEDVLKNKITIKVIIAMAALALSAPVFAQGRGGRGPAGPPPPAKNSNPVDLTGYWVSIVNEDWRYRMTVAPKGDVDGVPLT